MKVFCLKVHKERAGRSFPFDRVYLVRHDDRSILKQLFRHALVMPVEGSLKVLLKQLTLDRTIEHRFRRDDEALEPQAPESGAWTNMLDDGFWVMAVPILARWAEKAAPRYLVAQGWYRERKRGPNHGVKNEPLPMMSYLQTPEGNIRPVCAMCPRFIMHQNGDCKVGDKVCFEHLPLGLENYFQKGLSVPDAPANVKEPEERRVCVEEGP